MCFAYDQLGNDLTVPVAQTWRLDIKNKITQLSFTLEYEHVTTCLSKIATYNFKQVHIQPTDPNYIHKVLKFKIDFGHGNLSLTKKSEKTKKE